MFRSYFFLLPLLLWVGCTKGNPNFKGTTNLDGGVVVDLHTATQDAAATPDDLLTLPDLRPPPPPDLALPLCVEGARFCNDNKIITCQNEKFVLERQCPMGSSCKDASCQPPTSVPIGNVAGSNCEGDAGPSEMLCTAALGLSCQPFVQNGDIVWRCATAVGMGVPGTSCDEDEGIKCRTGFCGDNGSCFRSCTDDNQCPMTPQQNTRCKSVHITVEGQGLTAKSCIPQ